MIKVRAIANGYYGSKFRVPGEEFGIADEAAFSKAWMERASKSDDDATSTRRVNTGGTDGVTGAEAPKPGAKLSAKERRTLASTASGREITSTTEADAILAALEANGGSDNDDRERDKAVDATATAPLPDASAPDWEAAPPSSES